MLNIKNHKPILMQHGSLDCNFFVEKGKIYAIWGDNGVGKSTFFSYLKETWGSEIEMSFLEQTELKPLGQVSLYHVIKALRRQYAGQLEDIDSLIGMFRFEDLLRLPINQLSGGQKQMAKLILCLSKKAQLYCLDEPFNNLDEAKEQVVIQVLEAQKKLGKSFLIIEHDRSFVEKVVDQVFYFREKDGTDTYFLGA